MMNRIFHTVLSFIFTLILIGSLGKVMAQDTSSTIGRVSIASPTAASLGKYGDIPVSFHTGIPQIGIPIYTVQSGSLKLPIGLSYHASGLKVQEPAGWVGAGWSLDAGGVITRTVAGAPDDRGYFTSNVLYGHYTDYGYNSYILTNAQGPTDTLDDAAFERGAKDGQPDLYFFNFGGYSGKFYFNDDRTPIFVPEQDFKVQPFVVSGQGFTGFIVTTPDGTRYFFGQAGNNSPISPIESTNPFTVQNGPGNTTAAASSWFLNKILSADGMDSITLSYQAENYSYYTISTFPVVSTNYLQLSADYTMQNGMNVVKNLVAGVRLSQISFANGMVSFTQAASPRTDLSYSAGLLVSNSMTDAANTNSYALGSIRISDNNGFCKKDSFYLGYFYDANPLSGSIFSSYSSYNLHSDQYRLRLDSVQETSCDGTVKVPPYKFNYFGEQVLRRLSFGADHWGYSNGIDTNKTLVPSFTQIINMAPQVTWGGNREAIWPAMRGGALQQIAYPTGGSTKFDFEPKANYSFTNSTLQNVFLQGLVVHEHGQGNLTQTLPFTVSGTGGCTLIVNNTSSNWSPICTINNSSNTVVYNSGLINFSSTLNTSLSLPAGSYTVTLTFPPTSGPTLINGGDATVYQWQYVPTTINLAVGGLRIKTITNNDGVTPTNIVTNYSYFGTSQSTGILYSIPIYVQVLRNDAQKLVWGQLPAGQSCSPNGCVSCDGYSQHEFYISPGSVQPMNSLQGENVGYSEVDVSQTGNGHSVYRYYDSNLWGQSLTDVCQRTLNQSSLCDANIPSFPYPPVPFEFMRDELQYEGHFSQTGQILKEAYYFPRYTYDSMTTPGHISVNVPYLSTFTEYSLQSASKVKDSVVSILYDPSSGGRITTTNSTYYSSPFHHQPTRKVSSTSTGDSLVTNIKYAMDFRINSCDAIPDSLTYYITTATNDSAWLYANISSCSPQINDVSNCRWSTFGQFREMLSKNRVNFIKYRRRSYADSSNLLTNCYVAQLGSADTLLKPILRLQNMYQNAPIEVSEWKNLNLRHASFTKYDTSLTPVGFAYPGRIRLVNLQAPSASFSNATVSGNSLILDSRYLDESVYKFSSGNPQQIMARDGIPVSYIWDYSNKEPIAKISNATVDQVAYTSFESDGSGSWTIGSSIRDATSAITGKQNYNLSNGACSRSGLSSTTTYVVSYWSKTGNIYTVTGSTGFIQGKTILMNGSNWTYFEHTVTGVTSVSVSGTGGIDELRLYPSNAQMTTYTYSPLIGMTTQCDADNRISYYNYDGLGRLQVMKDQDGNILKTTEYHYMGQ